LERPAQRKFCQNRGQTEVQKVRQVQQADRESTFYSKCLEIIFGILTEELELLVVGKLPLLAATDRYKLIKVKNSFSNSPPTNYSNPPPLHARAIRSALTVAAEVEERRGSITNPDTQLPPSYHPFTPWPSYRCTRTAYLIPINNIYIYIHIHTYIHKHYDALGGEACVRFLRTKAQQEYDKHRLMCKDDEGKVATPPAYQFLAIYKIVSIKRVAGGIRITQPHSESRKRPGAPGPVNRGPADQAIRRSQRTRSGYNSLLSIVASGP